MIHSLKRALDRFGKTQNTADEEKYWKLKQKLKEDWNELYDRMMSIE